LNRRNGGKERDRHGPSGLAMKTVKRSSSILRLRIAFAHDEVAWRPGRTDRAGTRLLALAASTEPKRRAEVS
jgi:hypothetical protein